MKIATWALGSLLVFFSAMTFAQTDASKGGEAVSPAASHRWYLGGWIGLNPGGTLAFNRVKFSAFGDETDTGRLIYRANPSVSIALEAVYLKPNAWGFGIGIEADSEHGLNDPKFSSVGGKPATRINDGKISARLAYLNAIYRWDRFYLPFGLNVSNVTLKNPSVALTGADGVVGGQIGIGYFFNEHFAAEILGRGLNLDGEEQSVAGTTIDVRQGTLGGLQLIAKGYF